MCVCVCVVSCALRKKEEEACWIFLHALEDFHFDHNLSQGVRGSVASLWSGEKGWRERDERERDERGGERERDREKMRGREV